MSLICLEGASAVGKTTTCREIEKSYNAYIIPEVNLLFERPKTESKTWYMERQVERWVIAQEKLKTYDVVVLDGDIFQPLCYNWCFDFKIFNQSIEFITEYYRNELLQRRIGFPDKYFYLYTDQENLRQRKENDVSRKRGNFNSHMSIVEPHQRYYISLNDLLPNYVQQIKAETIDNNLKVIMGDSSSTMVLDNSFSLTLLMELRNGYLIIEHI